MVLLFFCCCFSGSSYGIGSDAQAQALCGFPAVEGIAVVGQQGEQFGLGEWVVQQDGGAQAAQQRGGGLAGDAGEGPRLLVLVQHQGVLCADVVALQLQGQCLALVIEQPQGDGDDEGLFCAGALAGGGRAALA